MEARKKKLPIGIENFEEIRTKGFYYVDKTGLIKELLENWGKVTLFTRPRRFGKSLNMSMLKSFFELGGRKEIFEGLEISKEVSLCEEYMGKIPVISISLKGVDAGSFETARELAVQIINGEARRFQCLLDSDRLTVYDKDAYTALLRADMSEAVLYGSLKVLSELLEKHYGRKVILLIDEYDVPLSKAFEQGYYDLSRNYEDVKEWYDGYRFGNVEVYCPWDVVNYCDELRADSNALPQNYWSNTSSNEVVRKFIQGADIGTTKNEIERLVAGEVIKKEIHQELTYKDMYNSIDNIWSILFTTGYLTQRGKPERKSFYLAIPNMEIREIFIEQIMDFFKENIKKNGDTVNAFCNALQKGEAEEVEKRFSDYLRKTISIRDTFVKKSKKENFYHGILLGLLGYKDTWIISSNEESGDGYSDILVRSEDEEIGIVIEVKYAENGKLEEACQEALQQIERKGYQEELQEEGIEHILKYGIACYKKRCKIMLVDDRPEAKK